MHYCAEGIRILSKIFTLIVLGSSILRMWASLFLYWFNKYNIVKTIFKDDSALFLMNKLEAYGLRFGSPKT